MTQQDDITQRLRDNAELDEAEHGNARVVQLEREAADEIERLRAELWQLRAPVAPEPFRAAFANGVLPATRFHELWESAAPSKNSGHTMLEDLTWQVGKFAALVAAEVSAPVADERQAVAYLDLGTGGYMDMDTDLTDEELAALPKGRHMLAIIGTHGVNGYTPVSAPIVDEWAVETFAERFAQALKPVAYTTKRGAVYLGKSTQVGTENLCTISQAVYEFRAALASAPVAGEAIYYAVMHGNALYGIFGTEAAAEACKAQGHPDAPFSVKPLYAAPQASAEPVQEVAGVTLDGCLETLFRVGEHLGINYAGSRKQPGAPSGVYIKAIEDRISQASNAAREEAAKLMDQTSRSSGAELIRALKTQADKDGGQWEPQTPEQIAAAMRNMARSEGFDWPEPDDGQQREGGSHENA